MSWDCECGYVNRDQDDQCLGCGEIPGGPAGNQVSSYEEIPVSYPASVPRVQEDNNGLYLTPGGAGIALICFFLPWVKLSCAGAEKNMSGADLGGIFWVVLVASAIILGAFFYFKGNGRLSSAKPVTILCALAGIGVMLFRYMQIQGGMKTEMGVIRASDLGLKIQFGAIGSLVGLALVVLGSAFLRDLPVRQSGYDGTNTGESGKAKSGEGRLAKMRERDATFCPHCGKNYPGDLTGQYCEECGSHLG